MILGILLEREVFFCFISKVLKCCYLKGFQVFYSSERWTNYSLIGTMERIVLMIRILEIGSIYEKKTNE